MRGTVLIALFVLAALLAAARPTYAAPPLVVLSETGQTRDGVPVLKPHPDEAAILETANQGFGRTVLRLYQFTQTYLQKQGGPAPESAYLLLKPGSGGFPKTGFHLEEQDRRQIDYVEVSPGRVGGKYSDAVRTFAHELNHTMVGKLAGKDRRKSPSTQIHSIGVRTDAYTAWIEGFAESFEVMFVDAPDADPATRAVRQDANAWANTQQLLDQYRNALGTPFSPAAITRFQFRSWYPVTEDLLRYHAVKENGFARQPAMPDRLYKGRNLYGAYLIESILPGAPIDPPKSSQRMLQSEGVVSALFYRWAMEEGLRNTYRDDSFYAQFGTTRADVTPVENLYLKLFHVLSASKPGTAAEVITAYKKSFPDEAALVDNVVSQILLGQTLPTAPEIWLANPSFRIGAMVYDQFRQLSHIYTFDLNGASLVDFLGVPGVDRRLAEAILKGAPYASLDDLQKIDGVTPALTERFRSMASRAEGMAHGDASPLLLSFSSWLLFVLGVGGVLGGILYRIIVKRAGWVRAILNGVGAALPCLVPFWLLGTWAQSLPLVVPILLFGLPVAVWDWWSTRDWHRGWQKLFGWAVAALPAFALLTLRF